MRLRTTVAAALAVIYTSAAGAQERHVLQTVGSAVVSGRSMIARVPEGRCALRRADGRESVAFEGVQASEPAYDVLVVHVPCGELETVARAGSVLAATDWGAVTAPRAQFGPLPRRSEAVFADEARRAAARRGSEDTLRSVFQNGAQPPFKHRLMPDHRVLLLDETWNEENGFFFSVRFRAAGAATYTGIEGVIVASNRLFRIGFYRRGEADLEAMQRNAAMIATELVRRQPNDPAEPELNTWIAKRAKTLVRPEGFCLYDASIPRDARRLFHVPRGTRRLLAIADCEQLSEMRESGLGLPGVHLFVIPTSASAPPNQLAVNTDLSTQMPVVSRGNEVEKLRPALARFFGNSAMESSIVGIVALDPTGAFFVEAVRKAEEPFGSGEFVSVQGLVWVHGEIVLATSLEPYRGAKQVAEQIDMLRGYARQLRLANN